jgi:hypothetical protein
MMALESNTMYGFISSGFEYKIQIYKVIDENDKALYSKAFGLDDCDLFLDVNYICSKTKDERSVGIRAILNRKVIWTEGDMSDKISQKGFCKCKRHKAVVEYINRLVKNLVFA